VGHQISVSLKKFDVVQALLSLVSFDTIPADSLKIYFILLFSFSKCADVPHFLPAIVQWPPIKTSHHFSVTSKSKCVINALMTLTFK
jgi:hypothetical protein